MNLSYTQLMRKFLLLALLAVGIAVLKRRSPTPTAGVWEPFTRP